MLGMSLAQMGLDCHCRFSAFGVIQRMRKSKEGVNMYLRRIRALGAIELHRRRAMKKKLNLVQ